MTAVHKIATWWPLDVMSLHSKHMPAYMKAVYCNTALYKVYMYACSQAWYATHTDHIHMYQLTACDVSVVQHSVVSDPGISQNERIQPKWCCRTPVSNLDKKLHGKRKKYIITLGFQGNIYFFLESSRKLSFHTRITKVTCTANPTVCSFLVHKMAAGQVGYFMSI